MMIKEVVMYLKSENIYQTLLNLVNVDKNKDKANSILEFIGFLFSYDDDDDINQIVSTIYQRTGPNDTFMSWAKTITERAKRFFIELFEKTDVTEFVDLTPQGWENLKCVLLDLNVELGNLKVLHSTKVTIKTETTETSPEGHTMGPVNNPQPSSSS